MHNGRTLKVTSSRYPVKLRIWLAFSALCLLSGSRWLVTEWQPEVLSGLLPIALRSGLLTVSFSIVQRDWKRSNRGRLPPGVLAPLLGWLVLFRAVPTAVAVRAGESVSLLTETLVFTLVPVFVVFFASQFAAGFGARETPLHLLTPALAGLAGAALLLPFHFPPSGVGQTWLGILLAMAALSARAAIQVHKLLAGVPVLAAAAIFSAAMFLVSAPLVFFQVGPAAWGSASTLIAEILKDILFDGPVTLLTVYLLREVAPVAFSSRYVLVPFVAVVEGYWMLRPETGWTTGVGMLLLASSGVWLFCSGSGEVSRDAPRVFRS